MTTTTTSNKFKYVFPLKSSGDLTAAIRLVEVLGLKQGEYTFNAFKGSIEVNRDDKWEEFLTNKIKELGFEDILQGKSYSEVKFDSITIPYTNLDTFSHLYGKAKLKYRHNKIELLTTEVDHVKGVAKATFKVLPNSKINKIDYAVALSIYNRCCYSIDSTSIDDLINSIPDEEIVKGLNAIKSIFF